MVFCIYVYKWDWFVFFCIIFVWFWCEDCVSLLITNWVFFFFVIYLEYLYNIGKGYYFYKVVKGLNEVIKVVNILFGIY